MINSALHQEPVCRRDVEEETFVISSSVPRCALRGGRGGFGRREAVTMEREGERERERKRSWKEEDREYASANTHTHTHTLAGIPCAD